jgi:CubicO group peptidase (beta-lactamase class C family)
VNPRAALIALILGCPLFAGNSFAESLATTEQEASEKLRDLTSEGFVGSVLVAREGRVVLEENAGFRHDLESPPSYWIASITKQFTAAAILRLQERGKLDIYDPIAEYLPGIPDDKTAISVFHLLTHTSGLRQDYAADGISDKSDALEALLVPELQSVPGESFAYANDNYNLLAMILEQASGKTYEDCLREEIFEPAGMTNAGSWGQPVPDGVFIPPIISPMNDDAMAANWGFRGATGMRASVQGLHAFLRAMDKLLTPESIDLLMGNHLQTAGGTEIGFNWFGRVSDDGIYMQFSRGQESFGGNAVIYIYPEDDLVIITATNAGPAESGDGAVTGWSRRAHEILARVYLRR